MVTSLPQLAPCFLPLLLLFLAHRWQQGDKVNTFKIKYFNGYILIRDTWVFKKQKNTAAVVSTSFDKKNPESSSTKTETRPNPWKCGLETKTRVLSSTTALKDTLTCRLRGPVLNDWPFNHQTTTLPCEWQLPPTQDTHPVHEIKLDRMLYLVYISTFGLYQPHEPDHIRVGYDWIVMECHSEMCFFWDMVALEIITSERFHTMIEKMSSQLKFYSYGAYS